MTENPIVGFIPQPVSYRKTGHFDVTTLSAQCGIFYYTGQHAELESQLPLCYVRLRVINLGSSAHDITTARQVLVTTTGGSVTPDREVMRVKRQPAVRTLSPHDAVEFDLWYTPPPGVVVTGVKVQGDTDNPGGGDVDVAPGPPAVEIPLVGVTGQNASNH